MPKARRDLRETNAEKDLTVVLAKAELLKVVRLKNGFHEVGRLLGGLYRSRMWTENAGETTEEHEEIFVSVGQYAAHIAKRYFSSRTAGSKFAKPGRFATPADAFDVSEASKCRPPRPPAKRPAGPPPRAATERAR